MLILDSIREMRTSSRQYSPARVLQGRSPNARFLSSRRRTARLLPLISPSSFSSHANDKLAVSLLHLVSLLTAARVLFSFPLRSFHHTSASLFLVSRSCYVVIKHGASASFETLNKCMPRSARARCDPNVVKLALGSLHRSSRMSGRRRI